MALPDRRWIEEQDQDDYRAGETEQDPVFCFQEGVGTGPDPVPDRAEVTFSGWKCLDPAVEVGSNQKREQGYDECEDLPKHVKHPHFLSINRPKSRQ